MLAIITIIITTVTATIMPNFLERISGHNLEACHLWFSLKVDMPQGTEKGDEILVRNISTA